MIAEPLQRVLEATGYLHLGQQCAPGVRMGEAAQEHRRGRRFRPDACWEGQSELRVYFKYIEDDISDETIATWRLEIWNEARSPLFWTVSPRRTVLYNAFGKPQQEDDAEANRLKTFENTASDLKKLDSFAGQLAMETGQFWQNEPRVNRKTGVDQQLLADLGALERDLVAEGLGGPEAQGLIGRCIFTQYLIDREIVGPDLLQQVCGQPSLPDALDDPSATRSLFAWLACTFNGDMFPTDPAETTLGRGSLERVAQFLLATNPRSGHRSLFPYRFDVIPVELISSIYEQFVHCGAKASAKGTDHRGVHYTRLAPLSLVLDEVLCEANGSETVLDLTCASGVFLVAALRRLVRLRSQGKEPTREIIRSTLHEQVFGVDIQETAVPLAAFSLYLAALDLDPDPTPPGALRFKPLIGTSLFVGDAKKIAGDDKRPPALTGSDGGPRKFDVIVGNPPWDFKGETGTEARKTGETPAAPRSPRGESLDFVNEARNFAHEATKFGLILSALPFFGGTSQNPPRSLLQSLAPVTLVNLSNLQSWLFPDANKPAAALFAGHRSDQHHDQLTVVQVPWSELGQRAHTFEIDPQDPVKVPISRLQRSPELLKAAAFGRHRDLLLLERLKERQATLAGQLVLLGTKLSHGPTFGGRKYLPHNVVHAPVPVFDRATRKRFGAGTNLPPLAPQPAGPPQTTSIYQVPLLLVKDSLTRTLGPRPVVSVTDPAMAHANGCVGAILPPADRATAHLLAGILTSALASWYFLMTSSTAGRRTHRLLVSDFIRFPVPELRSAVESAAGRRVLEIASSLHQRAWTGNDWNELDEAVAALYDLSECELIVVRDGLAKTSWTWQRSRRESVAPAGIVELECYARAYLGTIDAWLSARNVRRLRAEIFELPASASLRIVRFVLEERPGPSIIETVPVEDDLAAVLKQIGERLDVRIPDYLVGAQGVRVNGSEEVVIIKPSARQHWMGVLGLEDATALLAKSFPRGGT